jgi:Matrixin
MWRAPVACILLVTASACGGGGGSPTPLPGASSGPPPTTLAAAPSFFDGVTGAAVAAQITPAAPPNGQAATVTATGYLTRRQLFTGAPFQLWHAAEDYVHGFAYTEFTDGSFRTTRWAQPFVITLDGELATNDAVVAKTREVMAEIQRTTGLAVTLGAGGAVVIKIEPDLVETEDAVGLARLRFQGANVIGAELAFASRSEIVGSARADYANTLLHEMGHALGLDHSSDTRDVMTPGSGPGTRVGQYQEGEGAALRMMYVHRSAGNFFPDRDPGVAAASNARPVRTVIRD